MEWETAISSFRIKQRKCQKKNNFCIFLFIFPLSYLKLENDIFSVDSKQKVKDREERRFKSTTYIHRESFTIFTTFPGCIVNMYFDDYFCFCSSGLCQVFSSRNISIMENNEISCEKCQQTLSGFFLCFFFFTFRLNIFLMLLVNGMERNISLVDERRKIIFYYRNL